MWLWDPLQTPVLSLVLPWDPQNSVPLLGPLAFGPVHLALTAQASLLRCLERHYSSLPLTLSALRQTLAKSFLCVCSFSPC